MVERMVRIHEAQGSIPWFSILCYMYLLYISYINVRGSIVVSIPACHAGDPGSIPGLGVFLINYVNQLDNCLISIKKYKTNMKNILYHSNSFGSISNSLA